jgi:hypothetical protein
MQKPEHRFYWSNGNLCQLGKTCTPFFGCFQEKDYNLEFTYSTHDCLPATPSTYLGYHGLFSRSTAMTNAFQPVNNHTNRKEFSLEEITHIAAEMLREMLHFPSDGKRAGAIDDFLTVYKSYQQTYAQQITNLRQLLGQ